MSASHIITGLLQPVRRRVALYMLFGLLLAWLRFDAFPVGAFADDAHYVVLAESLASGQGYQLINYPIPRSEPAFPPGWPLLLAPLAAIAPGNHTLLKILPLAFYLASIPIAYALFSRRLPAPYVDILVVLIVLNPQIVATGTMLMSESAYICLSLLTLLIFERWDAQTGRSSRWLLPLSVILALLTQLVRSIGLTLLAAMGLYLVLTRRMWRLVMIIGIVLLAAWPQVLFFLRRGGSFVSTLYSSHIHWILAGALKEQEAWHDFIQHADDSIGQLLLPIFGTRIDALLAGVGLGALPLVLTLILIGLCLAGLILSLRRPALTDVYVLAYSAFVIVWILYVGWIQSRMLIPLIPFLLFYLLVVVRAILTRICRRRSRYVLLGTAAVALILAASALQANIADWRDPARNHMVDLSASTAWIQENTSESAIIMARNAEYSYLHTRRKTVDYPADDASLPDAIWNDTPDYIMISPPLEMGNTSELDEFTETQLLPALKSSTGQFELEYEDHAHNVKIYRVK